MLVELVVRLPKADRGVLLDQLAAFTNSHNFVVSRPAYLPSGCEFTMKLVYDHLRTAISKVPSTAIGRTDQGKHITMLLPGDYHLVRRTATTMDDIAAEDVVAVKAGRSDSGALVADDIRVYRNVLKDTELSAATLASSNRVVAIVGRVDGVSRTAGGAVVRIAYDSTQSDVLCRRRSRRLGSL